MNLSYISIISLNIGMSTSLAGLTSLILTHSVDLILLQEVTTSSEQLDSLLCGLGFQVEVNRDAGSPSSLGTAVAWRENLSIDGVFNIVPCRAQIVKLGSYAIFNLYAPSGSAKKKERDIFFRRDIFNALCLFPNYSHILAGDFNGIL